MYDKQNGAVFVFSFYMYVEQAAVGIFFNSFSKTSKTTEGHNILLGLLTKFWQSREIHLGSHLEPLIIIPTLDSTARRDQDPYQIGKHEKCHQVWLKSKETSFYPSNFLKLVLIVKVGNRKNPLV